jgi:hypothetical protein
MSEPADPQLVTEIARGIIAELAPEELPMFGLASQAYVSDPRRLSASADDDEMLGFGGGTQLELLTPVVLTVASGVVSYLLSTVFAAAKAEGQVLIQQQVKQLFKRFHAPEPDTKAPVTLTRDQLIEVRRVAYEIATRSGVTAAQAALLADSTVGQLAIAG